MVDTEIKIRGLEALNQKLGLVDAERFVCLIQRERLDYTQWRQTLFENVSGEELSRQAVKFQQVKALSKK